MIFVVFTILLQGTSTCHDHATCPKGQEESVTCNCSLFMWAMGGMLVGFAVLIIAYELCTHEGAVEMQATRVAHMGEAKQALLV